MNELNHAHHILSQYYFHFFPHPSQVWTTLTLTVAVSGRNGKELGAVNSWARMFWC